MEPSRSCWNGTTSALQPGEITWKGTRVSCVYYQVLIRKMSGNLFNDPRIYIYIYIYIYACLVKTADCFLFKIFK